MNMLPDRLRSLWPPRWPAPVALLAWFAWGVILGLFLHYVFYRVSLPVEPFIYVAF
ncbi:MAG TPA: hypothetical protein VL200_11020 [Lacunisphaera sp.]|jgi:hypothetical protein|nr:hypothetical protein [Lacunisphaera sp.]